MSIDNADLVRRLKEAKDDLQATKACEDIEQSYFIDRASKMIESVIKDLEIMVDDGK